MGYPHEYGFGQVQTTTPNVPAVVVAPAPTSIDQIKNFISTPTGILILLGTGLFIFQRMGYLSNLWKTMKGPEED